MHVKITHLRQKKRCDLSVKSRGVGISAIFGIIVRLFIALGLAIAKKR
jgi:hypothetical protein